MAIWRTAFERLNFDFVPAVKQTADVVFSTDIPYEDDRLDDFIQVAWDAMWKQNPHWTDSAAPLDGYSGWSSVMGGRKFTEVVDDPELDFDLGTPGEGLPRLCERFTLKAVGSRVHGTVDRSYRVTGFYKPYVFAPSSPEEDDLDVMLAELAAEDFADMTPEERRRHELTMRVIKCPREEASFVGGASVAGTISRIEDIIITGIVSWVPRKIAQERLKYKRANFNNANVVPIRKYWEA